MFPLFAHLATESINSMPRTTLNRQLPATRNRFEELSSSKHKKSFDDSVASFVSDA